MQDVSIPQLPDGYSGGLHFKEPVLFGFLSRRKPVSVLLEMCEDTPVVDDNSITYTAVVNVFGNSPAISQTNLGTVKLNRKTREVCVRSDSSHVELRGTMSPDFRSINGTIDLQQINLCGLRGDYLGHAIILEGFDDSS